MVSGKELLLALACACALMALLGHALVGCNEQELQPAAEWAWHDLP